MLLKIADLIDANAERLAMIETLDNGKPIRETMAIDVPLSSDHFRYFLAGVNNKMRVAQEEIFGPVVTFTKFKTEAEVIAMANDSEFGLGGAVWTKDINRALRVANGIETGRMWVNNYNNLPAHAPFGGYKKSGIGRETHKMILEHLTQKKNIFISMTETKVGLY
jgi:acyl-CoA reductase-like NAD-dependent aldehyde dehydrogenase